MDKKELTIVTSEIVENVHTILCDEIMPTEYTITCISDSVLLRTVIIWILHASKKVTVKISADHPDTQIDLQIYIRALDNAQHYLKVLQDHTAFNTISKCMIKGIAYDTSIIDYQGLITLEKESINAQAEQKSKFLIMSEMATVRSVPSLQVHHNQVVCGHATTISYLDPIIIWYSMQRGISATRLEKFIEHSLFV